MKIYVNTVYKHSESLQNLLSKSKVFADKTPIIKDSIILKNRHFITNVSKKKKV